MISLQHLFPFFGPSVFSWFSDRSSSGTISANGLASPDLQIITRAATNFIYNGIFTNGGFPPANSLRSLIGILQRILCISASLQSLHLFSRGFHRMIVIADHWEPDFTFRHTSEWFPDSSINIGNN